MMDGEQSVVVAADRRGIAASDELLAGGYGPHEA